MWALKILVVFNVVVIAVLFLGKGPDAESILVFNFYFFFIGILLAPFVSDVVENWIEKGAHIIRHVFREPFDVIAAFAGWYVLAYGLLAIVYRFGSKYVLN